MKVVQSWDDGVVDDIRLVELLRRYEAKAAFNLNPGLYQSQRSFGWQYGDKDVWRLSRHEITEIYTGFEITNHSGTHPNLPDLPAAALEQEVRDSRHRLQDWFQQPVRGFCYPFGSFNPMVKNAVCEAGHGYARTVKECEQPFPAIDPFELAVSCRFAAPDFWSRYEQTKATGGVFLFWGHSYELINEPMWADLENKITRISADPAAEWVDLDTLFN